MAELVRMPQAALANGQAISAEPVVILNVDGTPASGGGSGGGDASAANQTAVQALAGDNAAKATAIQGLDGGKAVPVSGIVAVTNGITASANFTPTATPYAAGDIQDVAKEFAFTDYLGVAVPAGSLIRILSSVMKIDVASIPSGMTDFTLRLYSATPPSAQADNAAWTLVSGDLSVYRGPINLGAPVDEGSCLYIKSQYIDTDIKMVTSSLWAELVTNGAYTPTAVARTVLLYGVRL